MTIGLLCHGDAGEAHYRPITGPLPAAQLPAKERLNLSGTPVTGTSAALITAWTNSSIPDRPHAWPRRRAVVATGLTVSQPGERPELTWIRLREQMADG